MTIIRAFFPKIRVLFSNFQKRTWETSPPPFPHSSYAPVSYCVFSIVTNQNYLIRKTKTYEKTYADTEEFRFNVPIAK